MQAKRRIWVTLTAAAVTALSGIGAGVHVAAQTPSVRSVAVADGFLAEQKRAKDLSGIFCRPARDGQFRCLVVNDEAIFAQWATYGTAGLVPGTDDASFITLLGKNSPTADTAFDDPAVLKLCAGGKSEKFDEFDGEAIAWMPGPEEGGTYIIVGSHSCSRGDSEDGVPPKTKLSTQLVARIQMLASGPKVDLTWRLGPALAVNALVGPHYHQPLLPGPDGLDIEGAAAVGGSLYLGLRAPAADRATILGVKPDDLFTPASTPGAAVALSSHRVSLGANTGIRDMVPLPDGHLLLLSGPAHNTKGHFGLHLVRPSNAADWGTPTALIPEIALPNKKSKAEGLAFLAMEGREARLLVLFEDPHDGVAELRVLLP